MFETLVVTFREGLEAFLIIAIMAAYLIKTEQRKLLIPLYVGTVAALLISATTGWHIAELAKNPIWEGSIAMVAGLMVASFTFLVMKYAKNIKKGIHQKLEIHSEKTGIFAFVGVFVFTTLMISREGMEAAMMLGAVSAQAESINMWIGAAFGLLSVVAIGWLWITQSDKINLKLFMQVTGVFLVLFAIDLFIYGIHELSEMYAIPFVGLGVNEFLHVNTEIFGHGSLYSQIISYGLIVVPSAWLVASAVSKRWSYQG